LDYEYEGESLNFHETQVTISVDLSAGFNLTDILVVRTGADEAAASLSCGVDAYYCYPNGTEILPAPSYTQGSALEVCIIVDPEDTHCCLVDILTMDVDQDQDADGDWDAHTDPITNRTTDPLSTKSCTEADGGLCYVKTQLPSKFFSVRNPANLTLTGVAILELCSNDATSPAPSLSISPSFAPSLSISPSHAPSSAPTRPWEGIALLTAGDYVILTKSGITNVPQSIITGNIGVSPIAATAMTGFDLILEPGGQFSTSTQFTGRADAASYGGAVATRLTAAVLNMEYAYTDAAGRLNGILNLGVGLLGVGGNSGGANEMLQPGVYTFGVNINIQEDIYFEGSGTGPNQGELDTFIMQTSGNLLQLMNTRVHLVNGALAKNIFWQVAGNVWLMEGAHMEGILLVKTDANFVTGASITGRVYAQTACVLQMNTVTEPPANWIESGF
jgi:hypothetical protein